MFFLSSLQDGRATTTTAGTVGRYGGEDEERAVWEGNSEITNV